MTRLAHSILGIWRLNSTRALDDSGNEVPPPFGPERQGLVEIYADGRMMCVETEECAESVQTGSYISFEGAYSLDGNMISTRVDRSSDTSLLGASLVREIKMSEAGMMVSRPPVSIDGVGVHLTLVWEKIV